MSNIKEHEWTTDDWIKKLKQQAEDSKEYRHKLYEKVALRNKRRVLDVGCGTGAVTMDIGLLTRGDVFGIDINAEKLQHAKRILSDVTNIKLMEADILNLPFDNSFFDLVVFNLFLIHIKDQQKAVNEMARVTQKNGIVLATLEIDYASTIEYPESSVSLLFLKNKKERGVDLYTGRKLKALFTRAGLRTEIGLNFESNCLLLNDDKKRLEVFLKNFWVHKKILQKNGWTNEQIDKYRSEKIEMIKNGLSFCFEPGFYAIGRKTT